MNSEASIGRGELPPDRVVSYTLAGNAVLTLQSVPTGAHYTFRVRRGEGCDERRLPACWWVDARADGDRWVGVGRIGDTPRRPLLARRGAPAGALAAFGWFWRRAQAGESHPDLRVFHEGRCGRCGRPLTHPESVQTGLGPVCAGRAS